MNVQTMMREANETGHVHIVGEMEFDTDKGAMHAFGQACAVAEACGYLVTRNGFAQFEVYGPNIPGYFVFDWFAPETKKLVKIEYWSSDAVYNDGQYFAAQRSMQDQ